MAKKLTLEQLRQIVSDELDEATMAQAKAQGPLSDLVSSLEQAKQSLGPAGAKKALSALFQQTNDKKAVEHVQRLLEAVTKIAKSIENVRGWLEHMPELTKDPWSEPGRR